MPFQSQAQRAYMYANHPSIAARWTREFGGGGKNLPQHKGDLGGHGKAQLNMRPTGTSSEESPNPRIQKLPRYPGEVRDFGMLKPSSSGRFIPKSKPHPNEIEATGEHHGVEWLHSHTHTEDNLAGEPKHSVGLHKRDIHTAEKGAFVGRFRPVRSTRTRKGKGRP